jgi:hypothetical protein
MYYTHVKVSIRLSKALIPAGLHFFNGCYQRKAWELRAGQMGGKAGGHGREGMAALWAQQRGHGSTTGTGEGAWQRYGQGRGVGKQNSRLSGYNI